MKLTTETKARAWDYQRQIDTLMDECGVYVEFVDCVMHHIDHLHEQLEATT